MAEFQDYVTISLLGIVFIILIQTVFGKSQAKPRLPPSPRALPVIGHMHLLGSIAHQALHNLSTRHGPLIHLFIGSIPNIVVSSPEIAKEILKTNESNFLNRPKMANIDYITYGSADFATAPYGPYWKFVKKICMTELLGSRTLDQFLPIRQEEVRKLLMLMLKKSEARETVNLGEELLNLSNTVISRMAFRQKYSGNRDERDRVVKMVKELNELAGFFNLSETFWFLRRLDLQGLKKKLKDARDRYDVMVESIMKAHEDDRKKRKEMKNEDDAVVKNLLDMLLDVHEDEDAEIKLTRENIKGFIMNIFGAGTDTSAITIEWGLSELINHPNILEKTRQEIDSVVGNNRIVQESDLPNLPYLQAVVKEILRLHPTGPLFARESSEECLIAGYRIPAKTRVIVNVWSLGRNPNFWENPLEFRPERFLGRDWGRDEFCMLTFGSGRRSCPGDKLALRFVPVVLAAIIQCFAFEIDGIVDMTEGPGSTLPRAKPLICVPVARFNPFPSV